MLIKTRGTSLSPEKEPFCISFQDQEEKDRFIEEIQSQELEFIPFRDEFKDEEISDLDNSQSDLNFKDRYLRCLSEFENYKKRNLKDKELLYENILVECLDIVFEIENDISIAMSSDKNCQGLKILKDKIVYNLSKFGVSQIKTDTYDPDLHHVVAYSDGGTYKEISSVVSNGWLRNDKPIVFSKIVLSSGKNE